MAKTSNPKPDGGIGAAPYAEAAASVGNAMVESMVQASQAYVEGLVAAGQEGASFVSQRLDTDMKTCNCLADCRSYEDFAQVQQDWMATALADYSQQWMRMAEVFANRMNGHGAAAGTAKPRSASPAKARSASPAKAQSSSTAKAPAASQDATQQ